MVHTQPNRAGLADNRLIFSPAARQGNVTRSGAVVKEGEAVDFAALTACYHPLVVIQAWLLSKEAAALDQPGNVVRADDQDGAY